MNVFMVDSKLIEENMVASLVWLDVQKNDDPSYTSYSWLKPVVESHIAVVSLDEEELFFFTKSIWAALGCGRQKELTTVLFF